MMNLIVDRMNLIYIYSGWCFTFCPNIVSAILCQLSIRRVVLGVEPGAQWGPVKRLVLLITGYEPFRLK